MARRAVAAGAIAPELADELPGLALAYVRVAASAGRSPTAVRRRLRELADRLGGAHVVEARRDEVPWAYRMLWHRLGIDPDVEHTPVERLLRDRIQHGGLRGHGLPADAIALATLETGVPLVALDAGAVVGRPVLRRAGAGESLAGEPEIELRAGEAIYADEWRPLARVAGGPLAAGCAPTRRTAAMLLCAPAPATVGEIVVEEALDIAASVLEGRAP